MTAVYHITHIRNLLSILDRGGLWCDNARSRMGLEPTGIAHEHIKARRARKVIPLQPGSSLAENVHLHSAPRPQFVDQTE